MSQIPLAPNIFTWPSDASQLIGGKCDRCAAVAFPRPSACSRCGCTEVAEHLLPRRGTLFSWTTQDFLPKEPYGGGETEETFRSYGVGLVTLGDEVKVEARLTEGTPDRLEFGMAVELVLVPLRIEPDGTEVLTFAFERV